MTVEDVRELIEYYMCIVKLTAIVIGHDDLFKLNFSN